MRPAAERWARVKQLFEAVVDLDAKERAAFLGRECGADESLHVEVESLLKSDERTDGFIERRDATTGRHRERAELVARIVENASVDSVRGPKQREVLAAIASAGAAGVRVEDLKREIDGAGAVLKSLAGRGIVALDAAPNTSGGGTAADVRAGGAC